MKLLIKRCVALGMSLALLAGCGQQKPVPTAQSQTPERDPNLIETRLSDGRVIQYTKQQLEEAKSWGFTKDVYESNLAAGYTHSALIETTKRNYWEQAHGVGLPTPAGGITPPPSVKTN